MARKSETFKFHDILYKGMNTDKLKEKLKNLGFTKEEEFKVEQCNELIEQLRRLRLSFTR